VHIQLLQSDITKIDVDVIVNAANTSLLGGGGVDGAIHRAGGPAILEACRAIRAKQGGCKVGEAVITTAGRLPAKMVIHTVGPRWNKGQSNEAEKLRNCYRNCLQLTEDHQFESIAFPNISTGIYGYPKAEAAQIAIATVQSWETVHLKTVIFVCFDAENYAIYQSLLQQ